MIIAVAVLVAVALIASRISYKSTNDEAHRIRVAGTTPMLVGGIYSVLGAIAHDESQYALIGSGFIAVVIGIGIALHLSKQYNAKTAQHSKHAMP